jgi:hypothetical protein
MRVEGARKARNGGWVHRMGEDAEAPRRPLLPLPCDRKLLDCGAYHAALRRKWDHWDVDGLSLDLGVDMDALETLQPAFDPLNQAFAFPMRDGAGSVCGIRLRDFEGRKWAVRGSHEGLFYDPGLSTCDDLVVCEGPTDTAAALSLGLQAVGRPACTGGVEALVVLAWRLRVRHVTIVADRDAPHRRPDGTAWYPGREGAEALARRIRRRWRMVLPPAKDFRAWLHAGATRKEFDSLCRSASWKLG